MKTNLNDFYNEAEITMENNALDISTVHQSIERACSQRYNSGRENFGESWVGERGAVEAHEELIDAIVYLGLEKRALLCEFNEDEDVMDGKMRARLDVLDKILDDIRGCVTGLSLFLNMTEGDHQWEKIFPKAAETN